jgi:hypothetical protein
LKLKFDILLSTSAFKFVLRRYSMGTDGGENKSLGWAVQVDSIKTRVESAYGVYNQRLKHTMS